MASTEKMDDDAAFENHEDEPERTLTIQTNYGFDFLSPAAQIMLRREYREYAPPSATRVLIIAAHNGLTPEKATGFWYQFVYYRDNEFIKATKPELVTYGRTSP